MTIYADPLCDLIGATMSEPCYNDQTMLEFALIDFRGMKPDMQKSLVVAMLDEFCKLAKEEKLKDSYAAGQILTRAQLIASFINAGKPGKVRMIKNG
jgi:hypothetical protein